MKPTTNPTTTSEKPLRVGWLARLVSFLGTAGAGDDDVDDDNTNVFGLDADEDDGTIEGDDEGDDDGDGDDADDLIDVPLDDEDDELEEDEDLDDEEEDEEDLEDDDEEEDDDEDEDWEPGEREELIRDKIERDLARRVQSGELGGIPRGMTLDKVQLADEAYARYQKLLESSDEDDGKATAKAMFEIAMDAVTQSLDQYHSKMVHEPYEKLTFSQARRQADRRKQEFDATPEGKAVAADPALRARMKTMFSEIQERYGWRAAMDVELRQYFRAAGGKVRKGKQKPAADPKAQRTTKKKKALAKGAPRNRRTTVAGGKTQRKARSEQQEQFEHIQRTSEPLFRVH